MKHRIGSLTAITAFLLMTSLAWAQAPAPAQGERGARGARGRGQAQPAVVSPEVAADRRIAFRIFAPQAQAVRLNASDIPNLGQTATLTKAENGVWSTTVGPVDPGAYRYTFSVDGVATIDPRSPSTSESNTNVWSMVYVPGADFMDTKEVPHGAVAEVPYFSTALKAWRRLHVYTPPGYEENNSKYPVFYLLHGAGDSDDSWTTVGRANYILDNLISAKKAKPMVVVMTAGHTPPQAQGARGGGGGGVGGFLSPADDFARDFVTDVMPLVEKRYRVMTDRAHTAIAGLSMGGSQTLNIAIPNLQRFAYIGVYSSGLIGDAGAGGRGGRGGRGDAQGATATVPAPAVPPATPATPDPNSWEGRNLAALDNANLKKGLKLVWFSTGKDDFLIETTRSTVETLKKHGFNVSYEESTGGHTWINWRNYLNVFAPQLFQ
jgi:enterochelin esterase family protein